MLDIRCNILNFPVQKSRQASFNSFLKKSQKDYVSFGSGNVSSTETKSFLQRQRFYNDNPENRAELQKIYDNLPEDYQEAFACLAAFAPLNEELPLIKSGGFDKKALTAVIQLPTETIDDFISLMTEQRVLLSLGKNQGSEEFYGITKTVKDFADLKLG